MSVFESCNEDEKIIIDEIVEASCEDHEGIEFCSGGETIDDNSVAGSVLLAEVTDNQEFLVSELIVENNNSSCGESSTETLRDENNVKDGVARGTSDESEVTIDSGGCGTSRQNGNVVDRSLPAGTHMEQEKRIRREIANSNERRRMQSINAGFQSLRTLLPHHEGEKLSKAAILQQTAEYIYQLEQEKTRLLSQNCQLKRLVNQHEGGDVPLKKRKSAQDTSGVAISLPKHVAESGDEDLGSISPKPMSVITVSLEGNAVVNGNGATISEAAELRRQLERERQRSERERQLLERERQQRLLLEEQLRAIQTQLYPERFRDNQLIAYQPHEVIEHTDNVMAQETEEAVATLQVVSVVSLPPVGSTQTVETSHPDTCSPPLSPQIVEVISEEIKDDEMSPESPRIVAFTTNQVFTGAIDDQVSSVGSFSPTTVAYATTVSFNGDFQSAPSTSQFITASPTRPFSPSPESQRLPSVLEAAIKAEPKVEVERLPSPSSSLDDGTPQARLYLANTSRQNLETIVEAIRHLEGDHLFGDEPAQVAPLALTNKQTSAGTSTTSAPTASTSTSSATTASSTRPTPVANETVGALKFHGQTQQPQQNQQSQQQRPGVIVVKHPPRDHQSH